MSVQYKQYLEMYAHEVHVIQPRANVERLKFLNSLAASLASTHKCPSAPLDSIVATSLLLATLFLLVSYLSLSPYPEALLLICSCSSATCSQDMLTQSVTNDSLAFCTHSATW